MRASSVMVLHIGCPDFAYFCYSNLTKTEDLGDFYHSTTSNLKLGASALKALRTFSDQMNFTAIYTQIMLF